MDKSYVGMMHCALCGKPIGVLLDRRLKDTFEHGKAYTDGHSLCDTCEEIIDVVENGGGVLFKCDECDCLGAVKPDSDSAKAFCEEFREFYNEQYPDSNVPAMAFDTCSEHEEYGIVTSQEGEVCPSKTNS